MRPWLLLLMLTTIAQARPNISHFKSIYFIHLKGEGTVVVNHKAHAGIKVTQVRTQVPQAKIFAKDHTLFIDTPKGSKVHVSLRHIQRITVGDQVKLQAQHIGIHHLFVAHANHRHHLLTRIRSLHSVVVQGSAFVRMMWLDTTLLSAHLSNQAKLRLVGHADRMVVKLKDHARLIAPFFHVKRIWAIAQDHAAADLFPVKLLHAYAKDHSQLRYYHYLSKSSGYFDSYDFANILYVIPTH